MDQGKPSPGPSRPVTPPRLAELEATLATLNRAVAARIAAAAAAERFNQRALAVLQGKIAERLRRIEALAKARRGR